MKVCPKCGRTEKEFPFIGYFCRDCYLEDQNLVHLPDKPEVQRCSLCGRIYVGRWVGFSLNSIHDWLKKKIRVDVKGATLGLSFPELGEKSIRFLYVVKGEVEGTPVEIKGEGKLRWVKTLCPRCARESGGYFEAIIQIRGRDCYARAEEVARLISREKGENNFISKAVQRREGIDLYVGSKKVADKVARKLEKARGVKPLRSHTLVTEKDGKRLYRLTIALHFKD